MKSSCSAKRFFCKACFSAVFAACFFLAGPLRAQTITEDRSLSFGTIALSGAGGTRQYILNANGTVDSLDPGIYIMSPPQEGEYTFTGGLPGRDYTVSFDNSTNLLHGGNTDFLIDNFTANPSTIHTDGSGEASFTMGGTLTTHPGGTYGDGHYTSTMSVTLTLVP